MKDTIIECYEMSLPLKCDSATGFTYDPKTGEYRSNNKSHTVKRVLCEKTSRKHR